MKNILEYIVVIFSIITSGSIIYTTYNDDLILIGFLMFLVFIFIITKKVSFNKYYFYYFIFSTAYFAIHPFLLGDISIINKYLGTIVRLSSFLLAISILGSRKFCYIYVKVMFVLCLLNLLLYIDHVYLLSFSKPISNLFDYGFTWAKQFKYENYIFLVKPTHHTDFIKNPGIFGEGGYYQYFINTALIINLFYQKKSIFTFANLIFVFSIISTYSTIGYIILFISVSTKYVFRFEKRIFYFSLPIILIGTYYFFQIPVIYNKLFNFESYEFIHSTQRRMIDTWIDLQIIYDRPTIGIGLGNNKVYDKYSEKFLGGTSSSNGILQHIVGIGFTGAIITLYPLIFFSNRTRKKYIILMCNILTGLTQGIIMTPLFLLSFSLLHEKLEKP